MMAMKSLDLFGMRCCLAALLLGACGGTESTSAADAATTDASQPSGPDAARPSGLDAAQPSGPDAAQPSGPDASQPSGPDASQPSGPDAAQPSGPDAAQPSGPDAAQPSGPDASQPSGPDAAQPSGPDASPPDAGGPLSVPRYGIWETQIPWPSGGYANPWEQVHVNVTLTAPGGHMVTIGGFYAAQDLWLARYSPSDLGAWTWRATISDATKSSESSGAFTVVESGAPGFIRIFADNRNRW